MTKKYVISFDGLNRSGKGTQIEYLANHLSKKGFSTLIMRGDGSRKGDGSLGDPYSTWWQDIQPKLREIDRRGEFDRAAWKKSSDMLNWELFQAYNNEMPQKIKESDCEKGFILLDRSIISKYFVNQRNPSNIRLEEILTFKSSQDKYERITLPDVSFVLHVPKEVLLKRNETVSDKPDKHGFRRRIISQYYDDFERITLGLKTDSLNIYHLNGNREENKIFKEVINYLAEVLRYV